MALLIGKKIQQRRHDIGLTQDQLARKADLPYTTLTKIESGVIRNPSIQTVIKISKGLGISLDQLLE